MRDLFSFSVAVFYFIFLVFMAFGWVLNIFKLFTTEMVMGTELALRLIGILVGPVGGIYGYF